MTSTYRAPKVGDDITVGVIPYRITQIIGSDHFDDEGQIWHLNVEHETGLTRSLVLNEVMYGDVWEYAR